MNKVNETIFKSDGHLIPMADVLFIEYDHENNDKRYYGTVIMKNTQWSNHRIHGYDYWLNPLNLGNEELRAFEKAYCQYRHEADEVNLRSDKNERKN